MLLTGSALLMIFIQYEGSGGVPFCLSVCLSAPLGFIAVVNILDGCDYYFTLPFLLCCEPQSNNKN